MKNIKLHSRRLFRAVGPGKALKELDDMATTLKNCGCLISRTPIGTVILELDDRFQYYVPRDSWIEEIIMIKKEEEKS